MLSCGCHSSRVTGVLSCPAAMAVAQRPHEAVSCPSCSLADRLQPWGSHLDCGPRDYNSDWKAHYFFSSFFYGKAQIKSGTNVPSSQEGVTSTEPPAQASCKGVLERRQGSGQNSFCPVLCPCVVCLAGVQGLLPHVLRSMGLGPDSVCPKFTSWWPGARQPPFLSLKRAMIASILLAGC